jgi:hypothetical protein
MEILVLAQLQFPLASRCRWQTQICRLRRNRILDFNYVVYPLNYFLLSSFLFAWQLVGKTHPGRVLRPSNVDSESLPPMSPVNDLPQPSVLAHITDVHCHPTDAQDGVPTNSMEQLQIKICAMSCYAVRSGESESARE